jgi:hypothetical protein
MTKRIKQTIVFFSLQEYIGVSEDKKIVFTGNQNVVASTVYQIISSNRKNISVLITETKFLLPRRTSEQEPNPIQSNHAQSILKIR